MTTFRNTTPVWPRTIGPRWPDGQSEKFTALRVVAAFKGEHALAAKSETGKHGAPWNGWVTYPCRVNEPDDWILEEDTDEIWYNRFRGGNGFLVTTEVCRLYAPEWTP